MNKYGVILFCFIGLFILSCNKGSTVVIVPETPAVDTTPILPPPPQPPTIPPFVDHWEKVSNNISDGKLQKYIAAIEYEGKMLFVATLQVNNGAGFGVYQYDTLFKSTTSLGVVSSSLGEYNPSVFLVQDKLYLHTLVNSTANVLRSFDLQRYIWTTKASITFYTLVPVLKLTSFSIGNYGYTYYNFGGSIASHTIYRYDPTADKWSIDASGLLTSNSFGAIAVTSGRNAFLLGSTNKLYKFNADSSTISTLPSFPTYCFYPYGFVLGNELHVGGGGDFTVGSLTPPGDTITSSTLTNRHWVYSLANHLWKEQDIFTGSKRTESIGFTYNGVGYVLGGRVLDSVTKQSVYIFDLWRYKP